MLGHRAATAQLLTQRSAAERAEVAEAVESSERRQAALREVRADRKAVEVAHAERVRYLAEKRAQLDAETRLLQNAECERDDLELCLQMLKEQVEKAEVALASREAEAHKARAAKVKAVASLEAQTLSGALDVGQKQNVADSERRVKMEQASYVQSLRARLNVDLQRCEEENSMERRASLGTSELMHTAAEAAGGGAPAGHEEEDSGHAMVGVDVSSVTATPPGRAGLLLAQQSSMAEWLIGLRGRRDELRTDLDAAKSKLAIAAQKAAEEDQRLVDRRANEMHQVRKLADYHNVLSKRLNLPAAHDGLMATAPPVVPGPPATSATATGRTLPSYVTPTTPSPPFLSLSSRSSGSSILAAAPGPSAARIDASPSEGKPSPFSPYPPRYLEVERFETGVGPGNTNAVDGWLGDESHDSRYNPDLRDPVALG